MTTGEITVNPFLSNRMPKPSKWGWAKTRCRASERLATVVTFQTFYMGELKRLKIETFVS